MAAEIFKMGDSFKLRQKYFTEFTFYRIKHWKTARDEGEDKGEEARLMKYLNQKRYSSEIQIDFPLWNGLLWVKHFQTRPKVAKGPHFSIRKENMNNSIMKQYLENLENLELKILVQLERSLLFLFHQKYCRGKRYVIVAMVAVCELCFQ